MGIEDQMQALTEAIKGLTYVVARMMEAHPPAQPQQRKKKEDQALFAPPAEQAKMQAETRVSEIPSAENPYAADLQAAATEDRMLVVLREAFTRIVQSKGEAVAKDLLSKYQIQSLVELDKSDQMSFLADVEAIESGQLKLGPPDPVPATSGATLDNIKVLMHELIMRHKAATTVMGLVAKYKCEHIDDLDPAYYGNFMEELQAIDRIPF